MKNIIKTVGLVFFLLPIFSCNTKLVVDDMVAFDQAFIPAFYYAYMGDLNNAQMAMYPLEQKWQKFRNKYKHNGKQSEDWKESIRLIGAWLEEANCAFADGDVLRGLFQLDHARYELMDIRWREKINDYYLDYVWELEATIDVAIQTANDPMLDLIEWKPFVQICYDVKGAYDKVLEQYFDAKTFNLTTAQMVNLIQEQNILGNRIDELLVALETADACQFAEAANAMEPAYLNFIAVLGDFETAQTYFAWTEID